MSVAPFGKLTIKKRAVRSGLAFFGFGVGSW
jgi:hypothetical protein